MAYNFRQQSRTRKFIYLGIIFALFTVSLFHRRMIIEPEANYLELRELARGEADLTGAAVRLLLTGSSGLATTFLWSNALDLQERHQFNRLKLVVESITKIQPHFSTPWIFQSWNLSFNVAVEFDSPRDKYFYISEGLNLLSRGERANQGRIDLASQDERLARIHRGNPDMRWFLGFTYQLKMGTSDENTTMRCLLDLSCIDPSKRDPDKLVQPDPSGGKKLDLQKFMAFCQDNPRLVRRLYSGLNLTDPMNIVQFLRDNGEVPGRFVMDTVKQEYVLRDWKDQFPILPLPFETGVPGHPKMPDLRDPALTSETIDVFLMSRTWFEYSQLPLPPPSGDQDVDRPRDVDKSKYRLPTRGWVVIFRSYPARAQFYISETLQNEGWFDSAGWDIRPWLQPDNPDQAPIPVGTDAKYHSAFAWGLAYEFYKDFGDKNGLYLAPAERRELEAKAEVFYNHRKKKGIGLDGERRVDEYAGEVGEGYEAHMKLVNNDSVRNTINFDDFLYQADAERSPRTVQARKTLFEAKKVRESRRNPDRVQELYEQGLALWQQVLIKYPGFGRVSTVQEELYNHELDFLLFTQKENSRLFINVLGGLAEVSWPYPPIAETLNKQAGGTPMYFRMARGPLEFVLVYDGKDAEAIKGGMHAAVVAQALAGNPLSPLSQVAVNPDLSLVRVAPREEARGPWRPLLSDDAIGAVRDQRNLARFE